VTVEFRIDVNGILDVTVTDRGTGKQTSEQLKADRRRLSPEQIAESQAKLALSYEDDDLEDEEFAEIEFDAGTMALLDRARHVLEDPSLDDGLAEQIRVTIDNIAASAADGDDEEVQSFCDQLIDLLFAAEA
jgi:molecular chaperone DnaK (HSP70)